MNLRRGFRAPDGRIPVEGYAEEISRVAGETCRIMLSGNGRVSLELRRAIHGDPHESGPGVKVEPVEWGQPSKLTLEEQLVDFGSYVRVPDAPELTPPGSFSLALWFRPTALRRDWQALAVKAKAGSFSYGLFVGGHRLLLGGVSGDGENVEWIAGSDYLQPDEWQLAVLVYSPTEGELRLHQSPPSSSRRAGPMGGDVVTSTRTVAVGAVHANDAALLLGACADPEPASPGHWAHFNGKLARPLLVGSALRQDAVAALAVGEDSSLQAVLGRWDLSRHVTTTRVVDVSVHGNHGVVVNAPGRAVTGPAWDRSIATLYEQRPDLYDAVHLHEDDLDDARWQPSLEIRIPETARSGLYCLAVRAGADLLEVPFVVRPRSARSPICVVVPTLTWQAYSSNAFPWSHTEDGVVDRGVCIYMPHTDGSIVNYVTRRKPTRSGSTSGGIRTWGAHTISSTLYLVDWLEEKELPYDMITDEDLHRESAAILTPYRCVVLGSHAEYWTLPMLDGLRQYLEGGGRATYLGGNGLYWVTSLDPSRSYLLEVRKGGEGDFDERWITPADGEAQHSTTLEVGGLWSRRGYPPRAIVGVEHASNVFEQAEGRWGFRRLPASRDERFAWVFDGIDDEVIGDFGLNLGSAAGYEMDAALEWEWGGAPADRAILARAEHEAFLEPKRLPTPRPVADLALSLFPNGGAVFAAGSVTWTGSLSWNGYDNNVSRTTENVIRRFLDTPRGSPVAEGPLAHGP